MVMNAKWTMNAPNQRRALDLNVLILVQDHAAITRIVELKNIIQYASVIKV